MNPAETTNWMPALLVLAAGAIAALAYLFVAKGKPAAGKAAKVPPSESDARAQELEHRAAQLIEELKELEVNKHQLPDATLVAERSRLEREAAGALRARDEYLKGKKAKAAAQAVTSGEAGAPAPATAPAAGGFFAQHPELKGAIYGAIAVAFFGALGLFLFRDEKPREDGGSMTGGSANRMGGQDQEAEMDRQFQAALDRAQQNPSDTELNAAVAHELIRRQDFQLARTLTERALGADPFHVENRIHRALLRAPGGDMKGAVEELQKIANTYPHAHEALLFIGSLAMNQPPELQNPRQIALEAFERYAAVAPADEQPPQLAEAIRMLREGGQQ